MMGPTFIYEWVLIRDSHPVEHSKSFTEKDKTTVFVVKGGRSLNF